MDAVATAAVGALGALLVAALAWFASLQRRVAALEDRNARLWVYCRKLIDHIYRGAPPPPPPADDLDALFPEGSPA